MTTTPRHSPSSSLSFRLVNYFIRYRAHINTFKTNCIPTYITNGAGARNSIAAVATSPTTTSLRAAFTSSGTFPIIRLSVSSYLFISLLFFNRCSLFVHPASVTHSGTSSTARPEAVPTPTSQMMATPTTWLDLTNFHWARRKLSNFHRLTSVSRRPKPTKKLIFVGFFLTSIGKFMFLL
jgi:hypothetical protein